VAIPESPAYPVAWYKSQRFIALVQSTILFALGWFITALGTNDWSNWKAGLVAILGNVAIGLKDWWSPSVVAPFALANRNNVVTVPASSVRAAEKSGGA
jgi:hypothetical protein